MEDVEEEAEQQTDQTVLGQLMRARRRFGRPETLVTRSVSGMFAVEGPVRFIAASALL